MEASEEERMTEDEILAQISCAFYPHRSPAYGNSAFILYDLSRTISLAGMDTTSNGLARTLHLLSGRPDVQEKLREEITDAIAKHGPEMDYDTLTGLPYLDAVCKETFRLWVSMARSHRYRAD